MNNLNELLNLKSKTSVVTGAAKGIGFAIANRLGQAGSNVLLADIDEDELIHATEQLTKLGINADYISTDVSKEDDIKAMVERCVDELGSINILVNNAGIYPPHLISEMSYENFKHVIDVNLTSVYLSTKYVAEQMRKQNTGGRIINITSIDALHPSMVGLAHYDSSKHGVWGFTKNAALEYAKDSIWINAIAPGGIVTPGVSQMQSSSTAVDEQTQKAMTEAFLAKIPMHRMGDPDEIGKVALFLASDMASYMTGEQIVVDGGALLS